jgi:hypothetical protein
MNLQFATRRKPGARHNEDLFGFRENTFWLLDGATSTDGPPLDRDAHWLVHEMDQALRALWAPDQDLVDLACQACAVVAERWPTPSLDRPVAAMALWRIQEGVLEAAITGNITLIAYVGIRAYEMTDNRILPAHVGASTELIKAIANGVPFESPEYQALRRKMKEQEAAALDIRAKSWLVSPSERSVEDFVTFAGPFEDNDLLLAATDGFMDLRRFIGHVDLMQFRKYVESANVKRSIDLLRTYERRPNSGLMYPRSKQHDDATVVLLSYP